MDNFPTSAQKAQNASFNTRRKAMGKAALVGKVSGLMGWDYSWALKCLLELSLRQEVMVMLPCALTPLPVSIAIQGEQ